MNGILYDAKTVCELLKVPVPDGISGAPSPGDGEIVIWSPGLSLCALRDNSVIQAKKLLWNDQTWYDRYGWSVAAGYHTVRMPVPGSNSKIFADQVKLLRSGEQPIPVALAALTWCVHRAKTGKDLLKGAFTRCAEQTPDGFRVGVLLGVGRLRVYDFWDDFPLDRVWLSSSRTS